MKITMEKRNSRGVLVKSVQVDPERQKYFEAAGFVAVSKDPPPVAPANDGEDSKPATGKNAGKKPKPAEQGQEPKDEQ